MITFAAEQAATRGWGGPVALAIVAAVYIAGVTLHHHFRGPHSPTEGDGPGVRVTPQVSSVSDTDDTKRDTGWWGRVITLPDGRRARAHAAEDVDDEVDVDLDDESETEEEAVARMLDDDVQYAEIVRCLRADFRVSEATAKRRIRDVRAERIAAASG